MTKPSRAPQAPPVDLTVLAHLESVRNRAGETVAEVLVRSFVDEIPELLDRAKLAARQADWSRLLVLAANIRSASDLVGARYLASRSLDLERAARTAWTDRVRRLIALLELEHRHALHYLSAARRNAAAPDQ